MSGSERVKKFFVAGAAAAAVTTIVVWLFQESAETKYKQGGDGFDVETVNRSKDDDTVKLKNTQKNDTIQAATIKSQQEMMDKVEEPMVKGGFKKCGNGEQLLQDYITGLLEMAHSAAENDKHGVGFINNFGQLIFIVTKPAHVKHVLANQVGHELGGMVHTSRAYFGAKVLFILEGQEWRSLRNLMRKSFVHKNLPLLSQDVTKVAYEFVNALTPLAGTGKPVDIHFAFAMYHLSAIGRAVFNFDLDCLSHISLGKDKISESFEYLLRELPRRAYSQDTALREDYESPTADNIEFKRQAAIVRGVIVEIVQARLDAQTKPGYVSRNDLLDRMIQTYNEEEGPSKDAQNLVDHLGDNLVEILFAGYNTSVGTMASALYYVCKNPQLFPVLQREVDAVLDKHVKGSSLDAKSFPMCQAIIWETLRLVPPAPLIYRSTETDTHLPDGPTLPAGVPIWLPIMHHHLDKSSWGPDADQFNPSRWLSPSPPHPPGAYTPFSGGPRDCIGKNFAMLESVVGLALFFRNFQATLPADFTFQPIFTGFGLRPFNASTMSLGVQLILTPRTMMTEKIFDWSPSTA